MHLRLFLHLVLLSASCCHAVPTLRQDTRTHHIPRHALEQEHPMARNKLRQKDRACDTVIVRIIYT